MLVVGLVSQDWETTPEETTYLTISQLEKSMSMPFWRDNSTVFIADKNLSAPAAMLYDTTTAAPGAFPNQCTLVAAVDANIGSSTDSLGMLLVDAIVDVYGLGGATQSSTSPAQPRSIPHEPIERPVRDMGLCKVPLEREVKEDYYLIPSQSTSSGSTLIARSSMSLSKN